MRALLYLNVLSHSPFRTFCPHSGGRQAWPPSGSSNSLKNVIRYRSLWGNGRHRSPTWVPGPGVIPDPRGSPPPPLDQSSFFARRRSIATRGGIIINPPASFPSANQIEEMEANHHSPDNVLLHDPSYRRRNKLHLTSPSGLDVVSEDVAVAVVAVGAIHRGQIATSVPVSAALGCLQLAPVHPAAL